LNVVLVYIDMLTFLSLLVNSTNALYPRAASLA